MTLNRAPKEQWRLRPARAEDASIIADLIVLTGDTRPEFAATSEPPAGLAMKKVAAAHARSFAVRHAILVEYAGHPAGVMLGYRMSRRLEAMRKETLPSHLRPIADVEAVCPGSYYINTLAIFPEFQGLGLGSRLLDEAAPREAKSLNCRSLTLEVDLSNTHALNFYRRHGFHAVPEEPATFNGRCPDAKDIVLMQRIIPYSSAFKRHQGNSEWQTPLSTWR